MVRADCSAAPHVLPAKQHFLESRRADSNRLPLLITSLLAYVLACTGASGNWLVYGVFDDLGVSVCPLCTSAYQPGCSTGCSTCVVGMRLCGSGAYTIPYIDPTPQHVGVCHRV